ncbi:MAG: sigma 54-interacting transcriptional regulator [Nitrospira sp.]|nr:sigma 54-interacting transcriptional regulator [Nitrospira sp.]
MNAKILIIDDEEGIRFTFGKFLKAKQYSVDTAKDFDEALECISTNDYDVIFADIILRGKTGIDVLREINKRNINCPVIMITGYPNIDTASEAIRLGAFDYIPKPIQKDTLFHVIDVALQHKAVMDEKEKYRLNLEAIFTSVKDAIISVDKDLNIIEINNAAKKICGLNRTIIGKKFNSEGEICNRNCVASLIDTINRKESVETGRIECQSKNKNDQTVSLTNFPLLDRHGLFSGAIMVVRDETRINSLERDLREQQGYHKIIGKSKKMQDIYSLIDLLSDVESTVLISGESGTGKELVAAALHYKGNRSNNNMVKVNCSALSENLLESELFGHVRGSFTGAVKDKTGRFKKADGGTIFLDEIADISPKIQIKLLRVLQEKEFEPVGDSKTIKVDVRVITASNQNLSKKVEAGLFREDLYYRLNVMKLILPPLRERRDDIPLLVEHFIAVFNKKFKKNISSISSDTKKIFLDYNWPGNVRELEHTIEHAFILCRQSIINVEHLPSELTNYNTRETSYDDNCNLDDPEVLISALKKSSWNKTKAAELLGISRRSIYRKIKDLNISQDRD